MTLAFSTMIASAQYSVLTTITSVEEEDKTTYNITDKIKAYGILEIDENHFVFQAFGTRTAARRHPRQVHIYIGI